MRSIWPMKGNPWPHDMVISVDDDPHQLVELLWVREAWGLHPAGSLPPLLTDPPPPVGDPDDREAWEAAWPEVWADVVRHAGVLVDHSRFEEDLRGTADGSPERANLFRQLIGPTWRDRFGDAAFDSSYRAWSERRFHALHRQRTRPLAETPERRALDALIRAWKAGLAKVVTIPCRGEYTRTLGGSVLLMTESTRSDPDRYAEALGTFAPR